MVFVSAKTPPLSPNLKGAFFIFPPKILTFHDNVIYYRHNKEMSNELNIRRKIR